MPLLYDEEASQAASCRVGALGLRGLGLRGRRHDDVPCGRPGLCGRLPLFPSSCMTRFIRQRFKIRDESCLTPAVINEILSTQPGYDGRVWSHRWIRRWDRYTSAEQP